MPIGRRTLVAPPEVGPRLIASSLNRERQSDDRWDFSATAITEVLLAGASRYLANDPVFSPLRCASRAVL